MNFFIRGELFFNEFLYRGDYFLMNFEIGWNYF